MRPYAHTHTCKWNNTKKTHKKLDGNIGRHLKKKNTGTPKVFQRMFFTYTLKEITALSCDDG
jgi:hypothetical protein